MYTKSIEESILRNLDTSMEISSHINTHNLRDLCVRMHFYDAGTVTDFGLLLDKCKDPGFDVVCVAADIWSHTSEDRKKELKELGYGLDSLLFDLYHECHYLLFNEK